MIGLVADALAEQAGAAAEIDHMGEATVPAVDRNQAASFAGTV